MKTTRVFLFFLLALQPGLPARSQSADVRPNILWIVSEDNSPLIGAYGDEFATTPNIDRFAAEAVRYTNAFATAPVCAPSRSALITGMYPSSVGTEHMRSVYPLPQFVKFFPAYLRRAGYYTTNNAKKDYNTVDQPDAWDESSATATYLSRRPGQPFFAVFNIALSHESQLHNSIPPAQLRHDPEKVPLPPYHPRTPEMKHDWAQYYDRIQQMDEKVGEILAALDAAGLRETTIVFYYSDHGGVLGRSKRFMYESGLHVPLIIRFPSKFRHLSPGDPGTAIDRIVSFVDFAPTVLSLAGVEPPPYLQGKPFLGSDTAGAQYAFASRGRMDERLDMVRSARDSKYRYIRNYMPHKIYGQYLEYLWKAPSMASWEKAFINGELNEVQSAFWKPKPPEELYDVDADPHNIHNLATDDAHKDVLLRMREATRQWMLETRDAGFIPEPMMVEISKTGSLFDYTHSDKYPLGEIMEAARLASSRNPADFPEIRTRLDHKNAVIRYWAAVGCTVLPAQAASEKKQLTRMLNDSEVSVRIAAAEALYVLNEKERSLETLRQALKSDNIMARVQALNVLDHMGKDATAAERDIRALLKDDIKDGDYDVRAAKRILGD
jgi:arylsulfatase A-like enzyme